MAMHSIQNGKALTEEEAKLLFSRHFASTKDRLHHFVWKLTRNETDTQDILQTTYLRLWQQIHAVGDDALPLLFTIARRLVIDHWRKTAGRTAPIEAAEEPASHEAEETLAYRESLRQLQNGIAQLPQKRQHIFRMVKEQGLSHEDVASRLGISRATVEKQIGLSLRFLRKEMDR
ncbi:RNA polymerase sigma factor [Chitinophaga lutea]